jgi:predicted ABC-type ATPase
MSSAQLEPQSKKLKLLNAVCRHDYRSNGSGKTTLTRHSTAIGVKFGTYINPDEIALTLPGAYDERVAGAQIEADRIRDQCLRERRSFSFETVMSHPSKVELLQRAKDLGFGVTLYFVSTQDPRINVNRVERRVALGGHDVPADRIVARYQRTMEMLPAAIDVADRAHLFDNSQFWKGTDATNLRLAASIKKSVGGGREIRLFEPTPSWVSDALKRLSVM